MQCSKCHKEAVITQQYSGRSYCMTHFIADIDSRAKKEIRKNGGIPSKEILFIRENNDFRSFSLRIFLSSLLLKRTDVVITNNSDRATILISPETLDIISNDVLETVLSGNPVKYLKKTGIKILYPFAAIPDDEIYLYASAYGWKKSYNKQTNSDTDAFLTSFSTTRPGTRFALKNIKDSLEIVK